MMNANAEPIIATNIFTKIKAITGGGWNLQFFDQCVRNSISGASAGILLGSVIANLVQFNSFSSEDLIQTVTIVGAAIGAIASAMLPNNSSEI
jgi:hypothetical protein